MTINTASSMAETSSTEPAPFRLTDEDLELLRAAMSAKLKEQEADILVCYRELPRLLEEGHEGRFALVHEGQIVSLWDTLEDAVQAGLDKYGLDRPFLTPTIQKRELDRLKVFLAQERAKQASP
jgi:hypothetical protein